MKQIKFLAILLLGSSFALTSCGDNECSHDEYINKIKKLEAEAEAAKKEKEEKEKEKEKNQTNAKTVEIKTVAMGDQEDPATQTGDFVKFSFNEGKVVEGDNWDFAVRGRLFLVNGRSEQGKSAGLIFGDKEPERTKNVMVATIIEEFGKVTNIGGLVKTDWHQDYHYANGSYDPTAPAISYSSNTRSSSNSRQAWHLRADKDRENRLILRPVVFIFKTQDGKVAKMVIEKMVRTNTDFKVKEDITYSIKYYYNPDGVSLDENK